MIRVLMVCMGNICRSPTAEGLLRHLLVQHAPELPVEVDSAGIHGYHLGDPPDRRAIEHAARRGIDLSSLRARQLTAEDFHHFDYVLCMDEGNLRSASALRPAEGRAHLALLMDYAATQGQREVPDPYYGGAEDFELVLDLTAAATLGLIGELRRRHSSPPPDQAP